MFSIGFCINILESTSIGFMSRAKTGLAEIDCLAFFETIIPRIRKLSVRFGPVLLGNNIYRKSIDSKQFFMYFSRMEFIRSLNL